MSPPNPIRLDLAGMNKPVDLGDILNQLETTEKQDKDKYNHVDTILQTKAEKFA
jgi:hypothetical protein